jgi:hypothetical protein
MNAEEHGNKHAGNNQNLQSNQAKMRSGKGGQQGGSAHGQHAMNQQMSRNAQMGGRNSQMKTGQMGGQHQQKKMGGQHPQGGGGKHPQMGGGGNRPHPSGQQQQQGKKKKLGEH